ncbi:MAG TPA: HIT domain-containing protein [Bacillota bacterium]|nr:HIT domain-containing protein [Bacillota bacterium]
MLTPEQAEQVKKQLAEQIEKSFPEDKKEFAKKQVENMDSEQLEEFLKKNQLIKTEEKSEGCVFCSIVSEKINSYKIDENAKGIAVLEINPVSKGHIMVIPKEHVVSSDKMPVSVFSLAKKVAKRLKTKFKPKSIEISSSNLFGHEVLNIIPLYGNENLSEKHLAKPEELEELQKILVKAQKAPRTKKLKEISKKSEKNIWLPKRIP